MLGGGKQASCIVPGGMVHQEMEIIRSFSQSLKFQELRSPPLLVDKSKFCLYITKNIH